MDRKSRRPKRVADVMSDMLSQSGLADRVAQARVIADWPALVGTQIASVTAPMSVTQQGTLFVAVKTNAWMAELTLLEPELLRRLNQRAGRLSIKKIRWQIRRE